MRYDQDGYYIAVAHARNGRPDGEWVHEDEPILARRNLGEHDGGHGMLFTAIDGERYICLHSPSQKSASGEVEEAILIPYDVKVGTVVPWFDK